MLFVRPAYAAPITNPSSFNSLGAVVSALLPAVHGIAGLLLFGYLLMGGIKYLTAGGDDKAIQSAKKTITSASVGMLIVFASFWIIRMVEAVVRFDILG